MIPEKLVGTFVNSSFDGISLAGTDMRGLFLVLGSFKGTDMNGANLSGSHLWGASMQKCILNGANLDGASVQYAIMDDALMAKIHATGADFTGSRLNGIIGTAGNFSSSNFTSSLLVNAQLKEANLSQSNMTGCDLRDANLHNANLSMVNFTDANLAGAILNGANIEGAVFTGADLTGTDISTSIQSRQEYESRRTTVMSEISGYLDSCSISRHDLVSLPPQILGLLDRVETLCRIDKEISKQRIFYRSFRARYRTTEGIVRVSIGEMTGKVCFDAIAAQPLDPRAFKFLLRDSVVSDHGGVTREAFTLAGEYIASRMNNVGGKLYFKTKGVGSFGKKVQHILKHALMQGVSIGLPLSYGILYMIKEGPLTFDMISLSTLMYLFKLDNYDDFLSSLRYLADDVLHALVDIEVGGYLRGREIGPDERFIWYKRFIYGRLFNNDGDSPAGDLAGFLNEHRPGGFSIHNIISIKYAGLEELASAFGQPITPADLLEIVSRASGHRSEELLRYVASITPEKAGLLVQFITGSRTKDVMITIRRVDGIDRLPASHTCGNILDLSGYSSYERFERLMDMALSDMSMTEL